MPLRVVPSPTGLPSKRGPGEVREPLLEPGVGTGLTGSHWWKWAMHRERARGGAIPGGAGRGSGREGAFALNCQPQQWGGRKLSNGDKGGRRDLVLKSQLDAWGWCTGTTQRDVTGREERGGFRMALGNSYTGEFD